MPIVDLSHVIADGTVTYPGLPGPVITDHLSREASRERYAPGYEFQIGRIDMVANTGTYLDTPFHRYPDGHDLAGPRPRPGGRRPGRRRRRPPATRRSAPTLLDGLDLAGRAVLFHTGWDRHWGTERYGEPEPPLPRRRRGRGAGRRAAPPLVGIDSVNIDGTRTGRAADPHGAARRRHPDRRAPHRPRRSSPAGRSGSSPCRRRSAGMGTFPVRAFAVVA